MGGQLTRPRLNAGPVRGGSGLSTGSSGVGIKARRASYSASCAEGLAAMASPADEPEREQKIADEGEGADIDPSMGPDRLGSRHRAYPPQD